MKHIEKGMWITFEGGEGAGKTSVIQRLLTKYENQFDIVVTREPGGIVISEKIRDIILDPAHQEMDGRTEALLYAAARRQHYVEKIVPALERGCVVLCDRFIDSSLAYQGYARGIGMDEVWSINQFAVGQRMPDLTLYFDIDPEVGQARIQANRDREVNRLDVEAVQFHHRVREGYLLLHRRNPDRIVKIDAHQRLEDVVEQASSQINRLLTDKTT